MTDRSISIASAIATSGPLVLLLRERYGSLRHRHSDLATASCGSGYPGSRRLGSTLHQLSRGGFRGAFSFWWGIVGLTGRQGKATGSTFCRLLLIL